MLTEESVVAGFRVEGPAHQGGRRPAFHAIVEATGERVTLKVLPRREDAAARVLRAREVLAQLDAPHPRVVPLVGFGEVDGHPYAVLRRIEGTPLATVVATSGALELARAVEVVEQLARPLDALHARGLVHGDVGPDAVLVAPSGQAYLDDLAVTRALEGDPEWEDVDPREDVRGLAVVAFAALAGVAPPRGGAVPLVGELRPGVPHALDVALQAALAPAPTQRTGTAGDLAAELRAALGGLPQAVAAGAPARDEEELAEIRRRAAAAAPASDEGAAGRGRRAGGGTPPPPGGAVAAQGARGRSRAGRLAAAVGVVGAAALALVVFGGGGDDAAPLARPPAAEVRAEDPAEASRDAAAQQRRAAERAERRAAARRREARERRERRERREARERAAAEPAPSPTPEAEAEAAPAPAPEPAPAPAPGPAAAPAPAPEPAPAPAPEPAPEPAPAPVPDSGGGDDGGESFDDAGDFDSDG